MRIAITGATGFLGHYLVKTLLNEGHHCQCWFRAGSDRSAFQDHQHLSWIEGGLSNEASMSALLDGAESVIHAGLYRQNLGSFQAQSGLFPFLDINLLGSLKLMDLAMQSGIRRFVYLSTCAVHDEILSDRKLDEAHPLWPRSVYGAHKAAIEKFIHATGLGGGWPVCALRPTGIYGLHHHVEKSKWFGLVKDIQSGKPIGVDKYRGGGGKEVHVQDVVSAINCLLNAEPSSIAGQVFNCYDQYISEYKVATLAKEITGSQSLIEIADKTPKNQIETGKLRAMGMTFGGDAMLKNTVEQLLAS